MFTAWNKQTNENKTEDRSNENTIRQEHTSGSTIPFCSIIQDYAWESPHHLLGKKLGLSPPPLCSSSDPLSHKAYLDMNQQEPWLSFRDWADLGHVLPSAMLWIHILSAPAM